MAINFPSSPTDQQVFTDNASGNQFIYFSTPGVWKNIKTSPITATTVAETVDAFTGNGSTVAFTLSVTSTTNNSIVTVSGVAQDPTSAYTISGSTLTFSAAPANGSTIRVRTPQGINAYGTAQAYTNFYFLATAGQTVITGTDQNSKTLAYNVGLIGVFLNGIKQVNGVDYTATNGSSITFLNALAVNDVVEIESYQSFSFVNPTSSSLTSVTINSLIYETAVILTTSTTAQVTADTLDGSTYRSAKYLIQCTDNTNNNYHVMELLLTHNYPTGSTAYVMPYGSTYTLNSLFTVDASVSGSNVNLLIIPTVANSTFKIFRIAVVA
jgi:hypothetical protein